MIAAASSGDEIHLFYRDRHHSDFVYYGRLGVVEITRKSDGPSRFIFRLVDL
jgi:putative restriction endonuclease